jgi:site-specific DNA-methyltransferase (adenine-specific)
MDFDLSTNRINNKPISRVYNCDNMAFMKEVPDKFFELAIVDPPYGIGADNKNSVHKLQCKKSSALSNNYGSQRWDSEVPNDLYFKELFRVSKNQIIWGANYFGLIGGYIYWRKNVTMPTYSSGELAYCSLINKIEEFEFTWHGMIQGNMSDKEARIHPTQKPVQLYKWLLYNYAKSGDKIFDSHLGSQSSRIASYHLGFDFWGTELDCEYFKDGCKRFERECHEIYTLKNGTTIKQQNLF